MARAKGKSDRGAPEVYVAAFGKHPGWNDHIDDLGVETDRMAAFKQLLYVQGIGGVIDSGAWDKLPPAQRREGFDHVFVSRGAGSIFVGRLWSSVDGKGRARYPMVLCAECRNLPLSWALREALPRLCALEERCRATRESMDVVAAVDQARADLRASAEKVEPGQAEMVLSPRALAEVADEPDMQPESRGLLRVLYQLEREMTPFLPGHEQDSQQHSPIQTRLPACGRSVEEIVARWTSVLLGRLRTGTPLWMILPRDLAWVDVLVGQPAAVQMTCFQTARDANPLASDIPYTLEEEFVQRCRKEIEASRKGEAAEVAVQAERPAPVRRAAGEAGERTPLLKSKAFLIVAGIVIAAAVLVGAALLVMSMSASSSKPPKENAGAVPQANGELAAPDAEAWRALCNGFSGWYSGLVRDVDEPRLERWEHDAHLAARVVPLLRRAQAGELKLDPRRIADVVGSDMRFLAARAPKKVRDPAVLAEVHAALAVMRKLEADLTADWPALRRMHEASKEYGSRGWAKPAEYVAAAAGRVKADADLADAVDEAAGVATRLAEIDGLWEKVQSQAKVLRESGSAVLARFGQYALVESRTEGKDARASDLTRLVERLTDVLALGAPVAAYVQGDWQSKVDRELVGRQSPVAVPQTDEQLRGGEVFRVWLAAVQGEKYAKLDATGDPRQADWKARQQAELASIGQKIEACAQRGSKKAEAFAARLKTMEADLAALMALRWDQEHRGEITRRAGEFRTAPAALLAETGAELAQLIGGRKAYIENLPPTISSTGSAAVNAAWKQRLGEVAKVDDLGQLTAKVNRLREDLGRLESELQVALGAEVESSDWSRRIATDVLAGQREKVLGKAIAAMGWRDAQYVRDDAFEAQWKTAREEFDRWRAGVATLVTEFSALEAALAMGAQADEKIGSGGKTLRELYQECAKRALIEEGSPLCQALQPLRQRLEAVLAAEAESERSKLVAQASQAVQGRFELARAAWRRLGKLAPAWPVDANEFYRERDLHAALASAYDLVKDDARRKALRDELGGETRRRWEGYFLRQSEPRLIRDTIARMGDFYFEAADRSSLQPVTQLRLAIYELRRKVLVEKPGDDALRSAVQEFVAAAGKLPGDTAGQPAVAAFVKELREASVAQEAGVDLGKAGPAAAGWKAEASADGASVKFTWNSQTGNRHSLVMARVEAPGVKPSYLCTTEVSLGLFLDVVEASGSWQELRKQLKLYASEDTRRGPRVWELAGDKRPIEAATWTAPILGVEESMIYPPELKVGQPKRTHPMQYISPAAAAYFAALLGCRLPNSGEWQAALPFEKDSAENVTNLRDKTWARQQKHLADCESQGKFVTDDLYPDRGIFWPRGAKRLEGAKAESLSSDDGLLWFAPVEAGRAKKFYHLVGNVAEFVLDDPAAAEQVDVRPAAAAEQVAKNTAKLGVIGGSALSDPRMETGKPQAVTAEEAAGGYADVGFRLALTAPSEPLSQRLRRVITARGYLVPAGEKRE